MTVLHVIVIGTGLLYAFLAWLVNENNAKYLLSGYNTMSAAEQAKFDITGYLKFFKPFFYNLALYSTLLFYLVFFLMDKNYALWTWITAQTLPLPYLIIKGNKFKKE
ncbi:DUF3784 domain-containing protein [Robiginitalea sp.]|jgi:hypothetical protein|nr:DUF3784 domain-containing protein [Robiginitalea sp.]